MAGPASNFVLNIVELQNTITSAGGTNPVTQLSNVVAQLQEMVIYDEKRIAVNTISAYNTTPIQVTASMNFASNTTLTVNSNTVAAGGAAYGSVSTIGYGTSLTQYYSTTGVGDTAIAMQVGVSSITPFSVTAGGTTVVAGPLKITGAGTPGIGKYLTCMDTAGTAEWQDPGMISDGRWKEEIRPLAEWSTILGSIRGVRFRWTGGGGADVGVIAQDVLPVLPEAVIEGVDGLPHRVAYQKLVPVLVEAVKALEARVVELERGLGGGAPAAARRAGLNSF